MILGIDYASVDGNHIEPAKTGAHFAYIRASAGLQTDPTWAMQRDAWRHVAPAGAYHALAWHTDPVVQARVAAACIGGRRDGELPPALDIEADSAAALHMTPEQCLAHAEACLRELVAHYGCITIYTSARVWADVLGNLPSDLMRTSPLWLKVPYAWKARNPPKLDSVPATFSIPGPWRTAGSAGVWMVQFQGDAVGLPGTTSTVDLNEFLSHDGLSLWCDDLLRAAGAADVKAFQAAHGLAVDGLIGPKTFAALAR